MNNKVLSVLDKKEQLILKLVDVIRNFYQNNDGRIKEYMEKLMFAAGDDKEKFKSQLIKVLTFYSKYLLKNQSSINNFATSYYENSKRIIELDFIKGYYNLLAINKCCLHPKDLNKNDLYVEKLYKKFDLLLHKHAETLTEEEQATVFKIKSAHKKYCERRLKKNSCIDEVHRELIIPLKRNLTEEDYPESAAKPLKKTKIRNFTNTIPPFFEKLPFELSTLVFSFLKPHDIMNVMCLNSFTYNTFMGSFVEKIDDLFQNVVISNTDALKGFVQCIPAIKLRKTPIKKLVFNFNKSSNKAFEFFSIKQVQHIINSVNIECLEIENKLWTLADLISLNLMPVTRKHNLKCLKVKISYVLNDSQRLEDHFMRFTCYNLDVLTIVYTDLVVLKKPFTLENQSSNSTSVVGDTHLVIGQPENRLKSLTILNNIVLSRYEKVMNYYKRKFLDLNISFSKLERLEELTIQNFNLQNQSQFWALIKQNEAIISKLELFKLHNFPDIVTLLFKLKNLKNLKTFSLQEPSTIKAISFLTINSLRIISNMYNTNNIPSHLLPKFLERYIIIPSWNNLKNLTLINTNINKALFLSLIQDKIVYLNISNNHNLIYNPLKAQLINGESSYFLTDFCFIKTLTPNLEVLVVAKLHFDTILSPFETNGRIIGQQSIYEALFWSKLRLLDLSFNGITYGNYKTIAQLSNDEMHLGVNTLISVGNGIVDEAIVEQLLDSGICNKLVSDFGHNSVRSAYDIWFEKGVLEKYDKETTEMHR